jgi:hypothetical protein
VFSDCVEHAGRTRTEKKTGVISPVYFYEARTNRLVGVEDDHPLQVLQVVTTVILVYVHMDIFV